MIYLLSKNKRTYTAIAKKYGCSALRVCALAHGKKAKTNQDYDVIQNLIDEKIVSGYRVA